MSQETRSKLAVLGGGVAIGAAVATLLFSAKSFTCQSKCTNKAEAKPVKQPTKQQVQPPAQQLDNPNPGLRRVPLSDVNQFFNNYEMAQQTLDQASAITNAVKSGGEDALIEYALKFKDLESKEQPYIVSRAEMKAAFDQLPKSEQELLNRTADRIFHFATKQRVCLTAMETDIIGGRGGHRVSAVDVAGCYAPGGRYPLPSSVLMTAVTARAAGVKTVVVASPRPVPATLAAAYVAKADYLLRIGGAQAIAAMAYGVGQVPQCDVIVGPGNRWVTAAKQLVSGVCGIDMLAGPSECLVIADETAKADVIAADLLAQSEHDVDARPILVTTSSQLADDVDQEIIKQLKTLSTAETARVAVSRGCAVVVSTIEEAIEASDIVAPEHLEVSGRLRVAFRG